MKVTKSINIDIFSFKAREKNTNLVEFVYSVHINNFLNWQYFTYQSRKPVAKRRALPSSGKKRTLLLRGHLTEVAQNFMMLEIIKLMTFQIVLIFCKVKYFYLMKPKIVTGRKIGKKSTYLTINTSDKGNITNLEYVERESYEAISFIDDNAVVIVRGTNLNKLPRLIMDWQVSELTEYKKSLHTFQEKNSMVISKIIIDHMESWRNKI